MARHGRRGCGTGGHCKPWRGILMLGRAYGWLLLCQRCAPGQELGRWGPCRHPRVLRHNLLARLCRLGRCDPGFHVMLARPCRIRSSVLDCPPPGAKTTPPWGSGSQGQGWPGATMAAWEHPCLTPCRGFAENGIVRHLGCLSA